MLKIKVKTSTFYITSYQNFYADIYIYLPIVNGELHPLLQSDNVKIFNHLLTTDELDSEWGCKYIHKVIMANTLDELNAKIEQLITEAHNVLQQLYRENVDKLSMI